MKGQQKQFDEYSSRYYAINREQRLEYERSRRDPVKKRAEHLRRTFGLTPEGFDELLAAQGGRCAVCLTPDPGRTQTWHIDHDHECCAGRTSCGRCLRGLLCNRCNLAIGHLNDDADLLEAAARYLRRVPMSPPTVTCYDAL